MNTKTVNERYIRQQFSTTLPAETIDSLKMAATIKKKKMYEFLDEIIIDYLIRNNLIEENLQNKS